MDVPNIATDVGQLAHLQAVHTAACMHGLVLYNVVTTTALGSALGSSIQSRTSISSCSIVLSLRSAAFYSEHTSVCLCACVGGCVCGALCHAHPPGVYRTAVYESSQSKAVRPSTVVCT